MTAAIRASVFVGVSVDGFLARPNHDLDFLPQGEGEEHGYTAFIASVDTLVIGRNTYDKVLTFGEWPYGEKRVVVLSNREIARPKARTAVVERMSGDPADIVARLAARGARHLYVDGGITIQRFLEAGLIQRLVITRVPVLIGQGIPCSGCSRRTLRCATSGRVTTRVAWCRASTWSATDMSATLLLSVLALTSGLGLLQAQRIERNLPYRAHATAEQHLDLYRPAGAARLPVVLFIHGGSLEESGERRKSPMYALVCPGLAQRGIVCATMDYRLAPSSQWPAMPEDVAAAVHWLRDSIASRGGDPARIFLVGHSSGCVLAALVGLDTSYLMHQGVPAGGVAGVVAMGCTLAPWDTAGRAVNRGSLNRVFQKDEEERRVYGTLAWRLRANPTSWIGPASPPVLVLVAESERYMPAVLEEGARFVRLMREQGRSADLRILAGRRHVTTTTGFEDPADPVANIVSDFVRDPKGVTATP